MHRIHTYWFECEDGHITVSQHESDREKCTAEEWLKAYHKGKRRHDWEEIEKKPGKKCGKPIIAKGEIPEALNYFEVWDHRIMQAFLISQRFDADFMIELQKNFVELDKRIDARGK